MKHFVKWIALLSATVLMLGACQRQPLSPLPEPASSSAEQAAGQDTAPVTDRETAAKTDEGPAAVPGKDTAQVTEGQTAAEQPPTTPTTPTTPTPTQGLKFELNEDKVSYRLVGIGSAKGTDIVIPSTHNALPVTAIGNSAFADRNTLKTVHVPEGVKEIGSSAFSNCTQLQNVSLPNSLERLGTNAFYKCSNLEGTVEQSLRYQGNSQNPYLVLIRPRSVSIKNAVVHKDTVFIASNAFSGCEDLKTLVVSDRVRSIGAAAFQSCYALTSVTLPNSLEEIGENIFPMSVKAAATVKDSALYLGNSQNPYLYLCAAENEEITSCSIAPGTKFIGSGAFSGCEALERVVFPEGLVGILERAFFGCSALQEALLPDSLRVTQSGVFERCSQLKRIRFGRNLKELGSALLSECPTVSEIEIHAENPDFYAAGNCLIERATGILWLGGTESVIPTDGSVKSIGYAAFSGRSGLQSIFIPASVTSIDHYAFWGCTGLSSIVYGGTRAQWSVMPKGSSWDSQMPTGYAVSCADDTAD